MDEDRGTQRHDALVGRTIDGRYLVDRVLAKGAMGTVYLARHVRLKKRVAVKVLHPDVAGHDELALRFEREALAGGQVSHPNVAGATDFGALDDGSRYLVMEYVRGEPLRRLIDVEAPLAPERAVRIARQIAVALSAIQQRGIVHRDLKPGNVMVGADDFVKVVDFGLAKVDDSRLSTLPTEEHEEQRLTVHGMIFGTVAYLAPESARGMEFVDARSDLYALGVICYEMLAGRHPFAAQSQAELFAQQVHDPVPPIGERAPGVTVPPALEGIVRKLLHKDPNERYEDAAALVAALDAAVPAGRDAPAEPAEWPPSVAAPSRAPAPGPGSPPPTAPRATPDDAPATEGARAEADGPAVVAAAAGEEAPPTRRAEGVDLPHTEQARQAGAGTAADGGPARPARPR
ncbi:MAG: serine/threonine protein kinase, partial [Polyangiaceae bacterium]|nr:serine/threonine protein kinase [Polyangiaceae bacterium]